MKKFTKIIFSVIINFFKFIFKKFGGRGEISLDKLASKNNIRSDKTHMKELEGNIYAQK